MRRQKPGNAEQLELDFEPKSHRLRIAGAPAWVLVAVGAVFALYIGGWVGSALIAKSAPIGDDAESEVRLQFEWKHRKPTTTQVVTTPRD